MRRKVVVTSAKARMALWAIFVVFGAILALVALMLLLGRGNDKKRCTQPVTAVVVDNETRRSKTMKNHSFTYAPVFEYEYRGQTYRHESSISTNPPRFQVGQRVELMIDPDNPATVYDKSGVADAACFIVLAASAVFMFIGFFGVSLNAKRLKQNKTDELPPSYSNWN